MLNIKTPVSLDFAKRPSRLGLFDQANSRLYYLFLHIPSEDGKQKITLYQLGLDSYEKKEIFSVLDIPKVNAFVSHGLPNQFTAISLKKDSPCLIERGSFFERKI